MSAPKIRIVFLDAATYGDMPLELFTNAWNCTVHQVTSPAETIERIAGQTIAVTNKAVIDKAILNSPEARDLKLIAVAATGTDIIDKEEAAKRGVKVCNVPGYATQSVAQFTLALILELATRAAEYGNTVIAGEWQKSPVFTLLTFPILELSGKKLGIIGYGNIGRAVAQMARGFGMEILIAARPGTNEPIATDRMAVNELLRQADIVTLHCPLTPETKNLINEQSLALMKPTALLINTARGALIDEAALIDALRSKKIAAAALDVISKEPPPPDHPIVLAASELPNLLVTPHTAWSAREARQRLLIEVKANVEAFLRGEPRNLVA
ncbi:MAG: D-2-hydroxyacid dehydrogenase [Deltaproteobacteria bacterium]|nr:D-2-hydroxyacid dehydrogenase [Deltaproteobacteria bacterium]